MGVVPLKRAMAPAPDRYTAEQRKANAAAMRRPALQPGLFTAAQLRHGRRYARNGDLRCRLDPQAYDAEVFTSRGPVRLRVFPQPEPIGAILHFHGGGWSLGSIYEQDALLSELALKARSTLTSIDYPLAPETVLPAALEIAGAALQEVISASRLPVCLFGESAGAHIALVLAQRLCSNRPDLLARVRGICLDYGIFDLSMTPSQRNWGDNFLGLSTPWLEWFYAQALPGVRREARADPSISPLYGPLAGLPPVLLNIGALDPLLDDSLFLSERLRAAGSSVTLRLFPEAPHGFNHADSGMARYCNDGIANFMLEQFTGPAAQERDR